MKRLILKLKEIVIVNKLFPRESVNKRIVDNYRKAMERGDKFPDLFVGLFKNKYYLIDGRHRYEAYAQMGAEYTDCEIKSNFTNFDEMFLSAVRHNLKHGHQLNTYDKLKIAYTLKDMHYETEDISKITGFAINKLEKMFVDDIKKVTIGERLKAKQLPEKLTTEVSKKAEREIGVVTSDGKILTKREIKDTEDIAELTEIYKFLKYRTFNLKNKKVSELLYKIEKMKLWRRTK